MTAVHFALPPRTAVRFAVSVPTQRCLSAFQPAVKSWYLPPRLVSFVRYALVSENMTLTAEEKFRIIIKLYPGIAQLVARLVRDQEAVGSNPATRTKNPPKSLILEDFCL